MKASSSLLGLVFACVVTFALIYASISSAQTRKSGEIVPGKYIVRVKKGIDSAAVANRHKVAPSCIYRRAVNGFACPMSEKKAKELAADPQILGVEPDRLILLDQQGQGRGWGNSGRITSPPQSLPTGVNRIDGDLNTTALIDGNDTRVNIDIAVIDTGIDLKHLDLNVVKNVTFVWGTKNGADDNGHGSHVAGTAAAIDNGIGVVGVAPGARLWAVKVLDRSGSGYLSWVIAGIDYVTQNAASIEVANMSLGFQGYSASFDAAIARSVAAGVTYAVAAGNSASDAINFSPANHPDVISVSAIADFDGVGGAQAQPTCRNDQDDSFADFSNYGSVVDIAAPGVCIYSTWKGGGYATISGTSMASPHVAGAAAVYKANNPAALPADVRSALIVNGKSQVDPDSPGHFFGFSGDPDPYPEPLVYAANL